MKTVLRTEDFRRVENLPLREWQTAYGNTYELASDLTQQLRQPEGEMILRPVQAVALKEMSDCGGMLGAIGVGHGKTIISLLAPSVMQSERPLLFLPAQLKRLTESEILPELRKHWKIDPNLRIESYHALSNDPTLLETYKPDLIIADECHKISRKNAARTKRILRYYDSSDDIRFVGLSGTITRRSLEDYWHLLLMALRSGAPIPLRWYEMQTWGMALDDGIAEGDRPSIGALKYLCSEDLNDCTRDVRRTLVRKAYRDRLVNTPGVLATSDTGVGASLFLHPRYIDLDEPITDALKILRDEWCTPDGEEITDAVDYWRKAREIGMGFYYVWQWPNGKDREWLEARKNWRRYIRHITSRSDRFDTEMLVTLACERGVLKSSEYDVWTLYKDRPEPLTKTVWLSDQVLDDALHIVDNRPVILWYEHRAVGDRLRALSIERGLNYPVFRGGTRANIDLVRHVDSGSGPCIASIRAHGVGVNLQSYSENIVLTPPSSGATWEQLIGRTHRSGQLADEVSFIVYLNTKETEKDFLNSCTNSRYIEDSTGQRQRLNYCSITGVG